MKFYILIVGVLLLSCTTNQSPFPLASPDKHGWSAQNLDSLAEFLEAAGSSAMLLVVDGETIFDWGETAQKRTIHSIRKPMLNALYGIKVAEGIIDTSKTLEQLGIDDRMKLTTQEKQATIADLLRSRSGIYHDAAAVSQGMLVGKPQRGEYLPGEHYYYNNWDFNVLGAILEQETGQSIYELFDEEIAQPLGMLHYKGQYATLDGDQEFDIPQDVDGFYQYEKSKSNFPAYHFRLSAYDMALFGQIYLNNGSKNGRQIIPVSWIDASTTPYSVTNPYYGIAYGMLWKVLMKNENRNSRSFYHTGAGVHMLGVYPESKLVLVHRVNTEQSYTFGEEDFYEMISKVWAAKID